MLLKSVSQVALMESLPVSVMYNLEPGKRLLMLNLKIVKQLAAVILKVFFKYFISFF